MLAVMHEIAAGNPPAPSKANRQLPAEFDRVIERALAKDKDQRYASAAEMMEALRALEPHPATTDVREVSRRAWVPIAVLGLLAVACAAAVYQWKTGNRHVPNPQAYELYLQGRRDIQEFTEHGFKRSVVDFKRTP
jgi:hypothetical protein